MNQLLTDVVERTIRSCYFLSKLFLNYRGTDCMKHSISYLKPLLVLFITVHLFACATTPLFESEGVNKTLKPATAGDQTGQTVLWGGTIIETRNQTDKTVIEVLAYPIQSDFRPNLDKDSEGRFLIEKSGYLEAREYTPGKAITVRGVLGTSKTGRIGEAEYRYAVVNAEKIKLWSKEKKPSSKILFGIGIGFHN